MPRVKIVKPARWDHGHVHVLRRVDLEAIEVGALSAVFRGHRNREGVSGMDH